MPDLIVPIKYTYPVHFIRTRCRLMETGIVQADGVVVVQSATSAEAPSAFRVERACPGHTKPFEVRCNETSLWWPVGDDSGFATPVDFLRGLAEGNSHHLGLLHEKIGSYIRSIRMLCRLLEFFNPHVMTSQMARYSR